MNIDISETDKGFFTVIVDGVYLADMLTKGEALEVVAWEFFSQNGTHHPYLRTYQSWVAWNQRYPDKVSTPVALLTHREGRA